jgi:hypothetical protein
MLQVLQQDQQGCLHRRYLLHLHRQRFARHLLQLQQLPRSRSGGFVRSVLYLSWNSLALWWLYCNLQLLYWTAD